MRQNPFKKLRRAHDFTLIDLCSMTYVSRSAMLRLEAGTYVNPLPSVVDWWVAHRCRICSKLDLTELTLSNAYEDFQLQSRQQHKHYFGAPDLQKYYNPTSLEHPFRQLRASKESGPVGITQVSRDLCLPLDTLQFFEKRYTRQQSVPKQLLFVLNYIGYSNKELQLFKQHYADWREQALARKTLNQVGWQ